MDRVVSVAAAEEEQLMHIRCNESEFARLQTQWGFLPIGASAVVYGERPVWDYAGEESIDPEGIIAAYLLTEDGWEQTKDFVEQDRPWSEDRIESLLAKYQTFEDVVWYFATRDEYGDNDPRAMYSAISKREYVTAKHVVHNGSYMYADPDTGDVQGGPDGLTLSRQYNVFRVTVPRGGPIEDAVDEIRRMIAIQNQIHDGLEFNYIPIMDYELSRYESRDLLVYANGRCVITRRYQDNHEFDTLEAAVCFISKHFWYGDVDKYNEEDENDGPY